MISVTIRGLEKAIEDINNFVITDAQLDQLVYEVAEQLQEWAKFDCPVDTGLLQSRITLDEVESGKGYKVYVDDVYYGIYVHDGTRYMPPRPFLLGHNAVKTEHLLKEKLKEFIKKR